MTDKKDFEINTDELENVAGGCGGNDGPDLTEHLPADHGKWVGKYDTEAYINKVLYFVKDDDNESFFLGKLTSSWEQSWDNSTTKRVYNIDVRWCNNDNIEVYCYNTVFGYFRTAKVGETLSGASGDMLTAFEYTGTQYK